LLRPLAGACSARWLERKHNSQGSDAVSSSVAGRAGGLCEAVQRARKPRQPRQAPAAVVARMPGRIPGKRGREATIPPDPVSLAVLPGVTCAGERCPSAAWRSVP
jgi:hypothetical protein